MQDDILSKILSKLERIERLMATSPFDQSHSITIKSFQPGGKDWMLTASDDEIRSYNRKKGIEKKRSRK